MGMRLYRVIVLFIYAITIAFILGIIFDYIQDGDIKNTFELFQKLSASFIPLGLLIIIQYIIWSRLSLIFAFEKYTIVTQIYKSFWWVLALIIYSAITYVAVMNGKANIILSIIKISVFSLFVIWLIWKNRLKKETLLTKVKRGEIMNDDDYLRLPKSQSKAMKIMKINQKNIERKENEH